MVYNTPKEALQAIQDGYKDPQAFAMLARHLFEVERTRGGGYVDESETCYEVVKFITSESNLYASTLEQVTRSFLVAIGDENTIDEEREMAALDDARYAYADDIRRPGWARRW